MKNILAVLFLTVCFIAIVFVIAQTENKYVFTPFEEKLLKADLGLDIFKSDKFLSLKFFTDLPVKIEGKGRQNPFNY